jgi:hypothetical protein
MAPRKRLYPVHIDGKSGYIDARARIAVTPRCDIAGDFHDGLAQVGNLDLDATCPGGEEVGYINKRGKFVWPMRG